VVDGFGGDVCRRCTEHNNTDGADERSEKDKEMMTYKREREKI
jgi:hypothetical protein